MPLCEYMDEPPALRGTDDKLVCGVWVLGDVLEFDEPRSVVGG